VIRVKALDVAAGQRVQFAALTREASRLEVEDAFFNTGSAMMLPDVPGQETPGGSKNLEFSNNEMWAALHVAHPEFAIIMRTTAFDPSAHGVDDDGRADGLHVILAVLRFLEQNSAHKLVAAGHADRAGDDAFNLRLSGARARNVVAVLEGRRAEFVDSCVLLHAAEDDGIVLHYAARTRGWMCDPADPSRPTPDEIRIFQQSFNADFGAKIATDGAVGNETRGAYFDLYQSDLEARAGGREALRALRSHLRFVDPAHKVLACGERFPIENAEADGLRSQRNRRVEMLFFAPPRVPNVAAPDAGEQIYRRRLFEFTALDRDALSPAVGDVPIAAATLTISPAPPPPPGIGDANDTFTTSLPNAGKSNPKAPWAFLSAFEQYHPDEGAEPSVRNSGRSRPPPPAPLPPVSGPTPLG